ncbi:acyltransferase family protein [Planctomycetota bacterium]
MNRLSEDVIASRMLRPAAARSVEKQKSAEIIDALRVIASVLIIWIHVPRSDAMIATTVVGRFAVPFFAFASVFFATQNGLQKRERTVWKYITTRFRRIYAPFVVWSGVYLAFKCVKLLVAPNQPNDFPGWEVLFVGTAYHLWFLPFIFVASIVAFAAAKQIPAKDARDGAVLIFLIGIICCRVGSESWPVHDGFRYAWQTTPAVLWAFAIALVANRTSVAQLQQLAVPIAFGLAGMSLLLLVVHGRNVVLENVCGMSLFVWAYWKVIDRPTPRWITTFASLSFGIYLSHMLFIKVAEAMTQKIGLVASPALDIAVLCGATIGSFGLCWLYGAARKACRNTRFGCMML